jgi:exopolysaccharide production protein ExoZ
MNPTPGRSAKLDSIQYLRAVAAAAVVVSHAANSLLGHTSHLIDLDYGAYGVDIFFVVSGFIMFYTTFETGMRPGAFLAKRLIRIFPLYFVLSTAMFILVTLSPASFNQESADFPSYLESVLFIPHWNPRLHNLEPIIGQGWTLNYEMFFYVLFALALFVRHRLAGIAALPAIGALVILGWLHPIQTPAFITYTSPLMLEFCIGIVVAATFVAPNRPNSRWPVVLLICLAASSACLYAFNPALHGSEAVRPFYVGMPCAILVTALVAIERGGLLPKFAFLALLGDASYSLYLAHGFVLGFGKRLWQQIVTVDSIAAHAAFIALILAASIVVAIPTYRILEVKLSRRLRSVVQGRAAG